MELGKIRKLVKTLFIPFYRKVFFNTSVAASVEHDTLLRTLGRDLSLVVDIGANRGQFSLVARYNFPHAKIIAFEPLREPATLFRRIFSCDPEVSLHEIAIGPEEKEMPIHVSFADDSSSLLPITTLQNSLFPGTSEKEARIIQVKPLASFLTEKEIKKPALLKIDVQGFEKQTLEGCKSLISCFTYVYVECSFLELYERQSLAHEVISFLDDFGFVLSGVYNLQYDRHGIAIQGDFLFLESGHSTPDRNTGLKSWNSKT